MNDLYKVYLRFNIISKDEPLRIRADLIAGFEKNTRGSTDLYTLLNDNGDSKVFTIEETPEEIIEAIQMAWKHINNG